MLKTIFKITLGGVLALAGTLFHFWNDRSPVLIESEESKTNEQGPVFNQIKWFSSSEKDVWMMQQSHHGVTAEGQKWDRLAIVIDKTKSPKAARFVQLEPGPLEWTEKLKPRNFRVSCFLCHTNGPRAIRPNFESRQAELSSLDKLKVFVWNIRIKTYGRILPDSSHDLRGQSSFVPFRIPGKMENEKLAVKTCLRCHSETGPISRGFLTRQNAMTIQFMVSKGYMPPLGFTLSESEKKEIGDFSEGF